MITTLDEYIESLTALRTRIAGETIILVFDRVVSPAAAAYLDDGDLDLIHEAIDDAINRAAGSL